MSDNERTARAALSRLFEPQDAAALALVRAAGAQDALGIASGRLTAGPALEQEITAILADSGSGSGWSGLAGALKRWAPRIPDLAPERDLATMQRLGGRLHHSLGRAVAPTAGRSRAPGAPVPVVARRRTGAAPGGQGHRPGGFPGQHQLRGLGHR